MQGETLGIMKKGFVKTESKYCEATEGQVSQMEGRGWIPDIVKRMKDRVLGLGRVLYFGMWRVHHCCSPSVLSSARKDYNSWPLPAHITEAC